MPETQVIDDPLVRLIEWHSPVAPPRSHQRATSDVSPGDELRVVPLPDRPPSSGS